MSFISPFLGRLSHSGDLLLWVGICRQASSINVFFSRTNGPILTKIGMYHLYGKETRKSIYISWPLTPRGGNVWVKSVKLMYFLKNSSSIDWGMVQKNWVYSYHYQGRVYQNCKFHDPQGRRFLLGHCHIHVSSEVCSNSNTWSPGNVMITSCIEDLLILFSKLDALQEVVLRGCLVYGVGDSSEKLRKCTPGIQELDLSLNLLPSWQRLGDICKCLPNLTDLNAR